MEVELLDVAVDTEGRGAAELVDEEEAVRWCGRPLLDDALPVRARGVSTGGGGFLGRDCWP